MKSLINQGKRLCIFKLIIVLFKRILSCQVEANEIKVNVKRTCFNFTFKLLQTKKQLQILFHNCFTFSDRVRIQT